VGFLIFIFYIELDMPDIPTFNYDKSFIYHINSAERLNGTPSNFNYKVQITNGSLEEYDSVVLLSTSIPKSYYAIEENKNTFTFENETTTQVSIDIPIGTYSAYDFCEKLKELLDANSGNTYTCEINLQTAKITITSSDLGSTFKILPGNFLYERFGFDKNSTNTSASGILVSSNVVDMSPENDLYIRSNVVSGGINSNEDILIDVQASGIPPFGRVQLYNTDLQGYTKGLNNKSNIFNFTLTNEFNEELNLNGVDWTMSLLFFKKSSIPATIKDFIRYIVQKF